MDNTVRIIDGDAWTEVVYPGGSRWQHHRPIYSESGDLLGYRCFTCSAKHDRITGRARNIVSIFCLTLIRHKSQVTDQVWHVNGPESAHGMPDTVQRLLKMHFQSLTSRYAEIDGRENTRVYSAAQVDKLLAYFANLDFKPSCGCMWQGSPAPFHVARLHQSGCIHSRD